MSETTRPSSCERKEEAAPNEFKRGVSPSAVIERDGETVCVCVCVSKLSCLMCGDYSQLNDSYILKKDLHKSGSGSGRRLHHVLRTQRSMEVARFSPFASAPKVSFWQALGARKLREWRLDESEQRIHGLYFAGTKGDLAAQARSGPWIRALKEVHTRREALEERGLSRWYKRLGRQPALENTKKCVRGVRGSDCARLLSQSPGFTISCRRRRRRHVRPGWKQTRRGRSARARALGFVSRKLEMVRVLKYADCIYT